MHWVIGLVGYIQNTTGDLLGAGRHNLEVPRGLAVRLTEFTELAVTDEPRE